jgi:hypothetical protein
MPSGVTAARSLLIRPSDLMGERWMARTRATGVG